MWRSPAPGLRWQVPRRGRQARKGPSVWRSEGIRNGMADFSDVLLDARARASLSSDHDRHRPDHRPLATLDIERRRDAAVADPGSYPVPSLRRPDARRSRRAGCPLWRECVVDRSPGAMPHGRVRWRDLLPCRPALWWTVAHPGRRCSAPRRAEPMPASPSCAWSTSPFQRRRSAARYRAPLTARPRQGSSPAWAETRHGARGAILEPGPAQPEPP